VADHYLGGNVPDGSQADNRSKLSIGKMQIRLYLRKSWHPGHDLNSKEEKKGFKQIDLSVGAQTLH
jgi:hypothetical protein